MANTLFDENRGGPTGNTHLALGQSYEELFTGDAAHTRPGRAITDAEITRLAAEAKAGYDVEQGFLTRTDLCQHRWILDTASGAWLDVPMARVELIVGLDYARTVSRW